jgi:hypothetical protein
MAETKTQRNTAAKATATRGRRPAKGKPPAASNKTKTAVDRTAEFSEEVAKSVEEGQRAAIDAVRKFVDIVDEKLPALGERPSRRQEVVDAAMEMADRLVHTQYDFIRNVVQSAGKALNRPNDGK